MSSLLFVFANNGTSMATLTIADPSNDTMSYGGSLKDGHKPLALAMAGSGVETLSGSNTYSGGTTLSGGTLSLGSSGVPRAEIFN